MALLAPLVFGCVILIVVIQTLTTFRFLQLLKRPPVPPMADDQCPKTAVILCLRGCDPFLEQCVRALLTQDYPHFGVRIVIDSEQDPAWDLVNRVVRDYPQQQVVVSSLQNPPETCSLKCSSLVQAIDELDPFFEVVAWLDADTIPHPTWLRELVAPLADPRVAATTGNRWYMPSTPTLGTMVRYAWNAAAANQMVCFHIAWGGTLAVKRSAIQETGLLDRWQNALCEDTMIYPILARHSLRQVFVPSLMMVNRESCTLSEFRIWVTRQLLMARLYHPGWLATMIHGAVTTLTMMIAIGGVIVALVQGDRTTVVWLAACIFLLEASFWGLLLFAERTLAGLFAQYGMKVDWLTTRAFFVMPIAILILQVLYPITLLHALFVQRIQWRDVRYHVGGPWKIRMEQYGPYQNPSPSDPARSL